jgi:endonuclease III
MIAKLKRDRSRLTITDSGKPIAIIISVEELEMLESPSRSSKDVSLPRQGITTIANGKYKRVAQLLLNARDTSKGYWPGLEKGRSASKQEANIFMLGAILDFQMNADTIWDKAEEFAQTTLKNPKNLWHKITRGSLPAWNAKWRKYSLHRYPKGHERVWTIGQRIVSQYDGDARQIWNGQTINEVLRRLNELKVGPQISRMIVGALQDVKILKGKGDVKVDLHVRRVLGRVLEGEGFSPGETDKVTKITGQMHPDNPWLLDSPLFFLRKCKAEQPECADCYLKAECLYHKNNAQEIS